jgi:hypothetical protein
MAARAGRGYVIVHGKIAFAGNSIDELNNNDLIRKFYLGLRDPRKLSFEVVVAGLSPKSGTPPGLSHLVCCRRG